MGKRGVFVLGFCAGAVVGVAFLLVLGISVAGLQDHAEWVPWRYHGFVEEEHLVFVPVRPPYPPGSICFGGYLTQVERATRKISFMLDSAGRPVECVE